MHFLFYWVLFALLCEYCLLELFVLCGVDCFCIFVTVNQSNYYCNIIFGLMLELKATNGTLFLVTVDHNRFKVMHYLSRGPQSGVYGLKSALVAIISAQKQAKYNYCAKHVSKYFFWCSVKMPRKMWMLRCVTGKPKQTI